MRATPLLLPRQGLHQTFAPMNEPFARQQAVAEVDIGQRLREAEVIVRNRAEGGALLGGTGAALLGGLLGAVFAVGRGLIPDLSTTLAVGLLGILLLALAGGFLGALVGGAIGSLAGAIEVGTALLLGRKLVRDV